MTRWFIRTGNRDIIGINIRQGDPDYVTSKNNFEAWLKNNRVSILKSWYDVPHYDFRTPGGQVSHEMMTSAWGPAERYVAPPPAPSKEYAVQYWSEADKPFAELLGRVLDGYVVRAERPEDVDTSSVSWVVVGAQEANPLFNRITESGQGIRKITEADKGFTFIQVGRFQPWADVVYTVAGYETGDTSDAVKYVRDNGLPPETLRFRTVPETDMQRAWREYFENPDVVKALGLVPGTIQESFSRVFTGYSITDGRPAPPEAGDYASVALIVAGIVAAASAVALALLPSAAGVPPATAATERIASGAHMIDLGYIEPGLTTAGNTAMSAMKAVPGSSGTILKGAMSIPGMGTFTKILLGGMLVAQLDFIAWGLGFCPTRVHDNIDRSIRSLRSTLITLNGLIKEGKFESAKSVIDEARVQIDETEKALESAPSKFFEGMGWSLEDMRTSFKTMRAEFQAYIDEYPQLRAVAVRFPKEFLLDDVIVEDGDTLVFPGHPEAANRIRIIGIDAHESETATGRAETEYLKSLIEHQQVTIKTEQYGTPEKTIDIYGRLLGGVFLGDQDIALAMLEHFGSSILTPTKYQDKYRWIDWGLYTKTAKAATGPAVTEFKISIDSVPSRAQLFVDGIYTHHLTPADAAELADVQELLAPGEHVFTAKKAGKEGSVKATITSGANEPINITLGVVGLEEAPPEEVAPAAPGVPVELPREVPEIFQISILSTPSRAKVYIDGTYTHHLTPSNEAELSDVMYLLTPGKHTIRAEKAGKAAEKDVEILPGANEPIYLTLDVIGLPVSKEDVEKEISALEARIAELRAELEKI